MNCPKCNKEVAPDWKLCPFCGFEPKKCSNPECQPRWLPQEAKFCPECGRSIEPCTEVEITPVLKPKVDDFDPKELETAINYCHSYEYQKALPILQKFAKLGAADAQYYLAKGYFDCFVWEIDKEEAFMWYRKAAEQGHVKAQYELAENGHLFRHIDDGEAAKWYNKAAEQGYAAAQYKLASCYLLGEGVDKDKGEAIRWYRKASEQGYAQAQHLLGVCYLYDEGKYKNIGEAVKWLKKAAEYGIKDAKKELRNAEKELRKIKF